MVETDYSPWLMWARGERKRWELSEGPPYYVRYSARTLTGDSYDPMVAMPGLTETFADLARSARLAQLHRGFTVDDRYHDESPDMQRARRFSQGDPEQVAVAAAEEIESVRREVLAFVSRYGPPNWVSLPPGTPWGVPVVQVLLDSLDLLRAIEASQAAKEESDTKAEAELCEQFYVHLEHVRIAPRPGDPGRHTCNSLRDAMWLGLFQAHFSAANWAACQHCGRLFLQGRRDQRFHDDACRNAAAVQRARERDKGGPRWHRGLGQTARAVSTASATTGPQR